MGNKAAFLRPVFRRVSSAVRVIPRRRNRKNRCGSWAYYSAASLMIGMSPIPTFYVETHVSQATRHWMPQGSGFKSLYWLLIANEALGEFAEDFSCITWAKVWSADGATNSRQKLSLFSTLSVGGGPCTLSARPHTD
ncbi:hypothetical protein AVEN_273067-1 [Araneus ventricosus]|uniref:Uncharacterized protein n=1 Tax=Araneus ventricosus TaxID=182803 RepID=A0A4Y2TCB6_ARAVE|nr:hypothetical protein AVEN_273067-1 [Araneus ventricosus]